MGPQQVSSHFIKFLKLAKVVDENGKNKIMLHELRHLFASVQVSAPNADLHFIKTVGGWENASTMLDTYGHYRHDPDAHQKFVRVPTFLDAVIDPDAPAQLPPPVQTLAPVLTAPTNGPFAGHGPAIEGSFAEIAPPPTGCPLEVPDYAERWLRPFLAELWKCGTVNQALVNFGKTRKQLTNELRRCRLPHFPELEEMALRAIGDAAAGDIVLEDEPEIETPVAVKPPCPWNIPEGAPAWVDPYIRCLDRGMTHRAACRADSERSRRRKRRAEAMEDRPPERDQAPPPREADRCPARGRRRRQGDRAHPEPGAGRPGQQPNRYGQEIPPRAEDTQR